jgi:oligopeptide transport system substrate-binding protein
MKLLQLTLLSITLLFTACTKKTDTSEKVLNIAVRSKIKGMDPIFANDRYSSNEISRVYDTLLEYHYLKRPFTLQPNVVEAMPTVSEDGLTYTFKISKGIMFHDDKAFPEGKGRELVAADYVYSIKRLADPKLQSTGWWILDGKVSGLNEWRRKYADLPKVDYSEEVAGLRALDKYTLQFKLIKPFPQFLYSLAMSFTVAVAKEVVDEYGQEFLNHPVGTGAFTLPMFNQTNKITYTKNPSYRKKMYPTEAAEEFKARGFLKDAGKTLPLVDKIVVNIIVEAQPRWLNLQKGKVDYIIIPKDNFDTAMTPDQTLADDLESRGFTLDITPSLDVTYTGFNHDLELFQNVKLRRAMSLAYDSTKSNTLFYSGRATPAQSVVPPGIGGNIKGYKNPYVGTDIEKAKKLLAEAGYPGGKGLPVIEYDCPASTATKQIGDFLKKRMALIGIKIKVQANPWPEFQKKITNRKIMLYGIAWGADYPDAENFLQLLYGPNKAPGANGSGYANPEFDAMFVKASRMQDSPERTALYEKMTQFIAEEVPWMFGVHRQQYTIMTGWVTNYMWSDFDNGQEKYLNVDMDKKAKLIKTL